MNWQRIKDEWDAYRPRVKRRWPRLGDGRLDSVDGNRTELMSALQDEYGLSLEEAGVEVDRWADEVTEHGATDG